MNKIEYVLEQLNLTEPFDITLDLLDKYQAIYSSLGGGAITQKSNAKYNRKIAALNLIKYKKLHNFPITEGFVYCISNPAWPGLYKVGMTQDVSKRINAYQTYSPFRDFRLEWYRFVFDKREGEKILHNMLDTYTVKGEWFEIPDLSLLRNHWISSSIG